MIQLEGGIKLTGKRKHRKDPDTPARIVVHAAIHHLLKSRALDENRSIQEIAHGIFCQEFERKDLIVEEAEPARAQ
jgi:hypothetical protein